MTTRNHTKSNAGNHTNFVLVTWSGLLNGEAGDALTLPFYADKTVQILGTFGSGGTIVIEGSNDGTNYATLTDPSDNALSKGAASIETIMQNPLYIRPRVTAGDGTTNLTVIIACRSSI